jgi:hypothetical protein
MPTHQAMATMASPPSGVPLSSPRTVSMIGVNGWYSANSRRPGPILSAGTIALLKNGSMTSGTEAMPAVSGDFAASPRATVSHPAAKLSSTMMPSTPSQSRKLADGLKPSAKATPTRAAMAIRLVSTLATTCPVSTAPRETSMTLKRLMMPLVMSEFTDVAAAPSP